jgi:hypothetical protein
MPAAPAGTSWLGMRRGRGERAGLCMCAVRGGDRSWIGMGELALARPPVLCVTPVPSMFVKIPDLMLF